MWGGLTPILILHVLLLPLNTLRLMQLRNLSGQIERAARETFSPQALLSLMRHREIKANETLFSANDPASELFYVVEGTLFLPELQHEIGPGSFLGEFALFYVGPAYGHRDRADRLHADEPQPRRRLHRPRPGAATRHPPAQADHDALPAECRPGSEDPARDRPRAGRVRREAGRIPLLNPGARTAIRIAVLASVALVVWLAYHPVYTMLYRDAVVTTWLNVVAAPIAGTIEDFDLRRR